MAKAILVLDEMPKSCYDCPLNYDMYTCLFVPKSNTIAMGEERLEGCPLRDLPLRMGTDDNGIMGAFVAGYNTCLNMIEGKEGE